MPSFIVRAVLHRDPKRGWSRCKTAPANLRPSSAAVNGNTRIGFTNFNKEETLEKA